MELIIGNKNYSSWSLRPWILMRALAIPFSERLIRLDATDFDVQLVTAYFRWCKPLIGSPHHQPAEVPYPLLGDQGHSVAHHP
jgi:hypothetical protein